MRWSPQQLSSRCPRSGGSALSGGVSTAYGTPDRRRMALCGDAFDTADRSGWPDHGPDRRGGRAVTPTPGTARPLLLVGTPRSGTTWTMRVLEADPSLLPLMEPDNESRSAPAVWAKRALRSVPGPGPRRSRTTTTAGCGRGSSKGPSKAPDSPPPPPSCERCGHVGGAATTRDGRRPPCGWPERWPPVPRSPRPPGSPTGGSSSRRSTHRCPWIGWPRSSRSTSSCSSGIPATCWRAGSPWT